jgi:hypothetical protein
VLKSKTDINPPRALRGRRARRLWRHLAPVAAANGALSAVTAPLLASLCQKLAYAEEEPGCVSSSHINDIARLTKLLNLSENRGK